MATPVYKAAYSGLLKAFLDLLPSSALAEKGVLPIATAGSLAHCLVLEYALKPVLAALGASTFLPAVCLLDTDFVYEGQRLSRLETAAGDRLAASLDALESDVLAAARGPRAYWRSPYDPENRRTIMFTALINQSRRLVKLGLDATALAGLAHLTAPRRACPGAEVRIGFQKGRRICWSSRRRATSSST